MGTLCMGCMQVKQSNPRCEHCGYDERSQNNTHQLPVGTIVGRQYTLGKVLGQGGFGITYVGWDNIMQQRVAVKEYFPSGYAGRGTHSLTVTSYDGAGKQDFESNKRRFLREADALAKLQNVPQIVRILRHFEENGTAYIAMEYVEGMDLRKYLKQHRGPLSMEETLTILGPVIQALAQVHRAELVHRDISPDNIMVLPDGSTKLLDFGAARYVRNANAYEDRDTSTQAILKHGFAPPEQYSTHGALGPWTDVYAMCATVYYCLTGRVPPEAMIRSVEGAAMNWDGIPGLTKQQKAALEKGMTLQPGKRFASMEELWQQLKPAEPKPEPRKHKKSKSNKPLLITAVAATAVAVAMISMNFLPKDIRELPQETQQIQVPETASDAGEMPEEPSIPAETSKNFEPEDLIPSSEEAPMLTEPVSTVPDIPNDAPSTRADTEPEQESLIYSMGDFGLIYEINDTGVTITGYEGKLPAELELPSVMNGNPVTKIGFEAFCGCTALQNVILPNSTKNIRESAFEGCIKLTNVTIPGSVTSIGGLAFGNTPWLAAQKDEFVILGDGILLKYNGTAAHVEIPPNVKKISSAFYNCTALSSIRIPESVTSIGSYAFYKCGGLKSVTIPNGVSSIGDYAFYECTGLKDVIFPEDGTDIGLRAFSGCTGLTRIDIPGNGSSIGSYAFSDCTGLTNVTIQKGLATMGIGSPFKGCTNLKTATLPRNSGNWDGMFPSGCSITHYK